MILKKILRGAWSVLKFFAALTLLQLLLAVLIGLPWYVADRYGWPGWIAALALWGIAGAIGKSIFGDEPTDPY